MEAGRTAVTCPALARTSLAGTSLARTSLEENQLINSHARGLAAPRIRVNKLVLMKHITLIQSICTSLHRTSLACTSLSENRCNQFVCYKPI